MYIDWVILQSFMNKRQIFQASLGLCVLAGSAFGEARLAKIFSDHMVLQREQPIHVWGWSNPGETVTVRFKGASDSTEGDRLGHWNVYLPPMKAGGPYQLAVEATNRIELRDVLVGDVWFASGQSNMEMPLRGFPGSAVVNNADEEIRNANHSDIRLFLVEHKTSDYPLNDFAGRETWTECTSKTAAEFSAVAYFFGRHIAEDQHVPIGLIDSTWGGTPAEAWMSLDGISADAGLMPVFSERTRMENIQADLPEIQAAEKREDAEARAAHRPLPVLSWHPNPVCWGPTKLYNGMIAPAVGFAMRGVIWYQGETNSAVERAAMYEKIFPAMIRDWRAHWQQGAFPFLYVQISSYKSNETEIWPVVRDAQRHTLELTNTGMAVTIDIGDRDNVHPSDKQTVGARLAIAARAIAYGEKLEYSGPLFREATTHQGEMRVWFDHAGGGLVAKGGQLEGFEIAGRDCKFVPATARIDAESVVISSPDVKRPEYVRYGWQNAPVVNLFNSEGLPASPFTSETPFPKAE